jgi:hypothetical protein
VADLPGKKKYIPPYTPRSSISSNNNSATASQNPAKHTVLEIVQSYQKTIATSSFNNNATSTCPPKVKPADRFTTYNSPESAAVNKPVNPVSQGNTTPLPKSAAVNRPVKTVSQETATPLPKDHNAAKTPSSLSISVVNQTPSIKKSSNLNQTDLTTPKQSHQQQQQQQLIRSKPTSSKSKRSRARMTEEELNTSCKFILSYLLFFFYLDYYILVKD